jgi:hypothetical protein
VHPVHGSTVDRPFKTKGYVIRAARARSDGPGRVRAGCGGDVAGVRRRAAGVRRRWPWTALPATNPTSSWCKTMWGCLRTRQGGLWGQLCLPGGRHRKGAERPLRRACGCAAMHDRKGKRAGKIAHSSKEWRGELEGEEDATAAKLGNGGGSGDAPVWSRRGSHGLWGREPAANRA